MSSLPSAIYAEQSVLGCFLVDPATHWHIAKLTEDHFYTSSHKKVFSAIKQADATSSPIDAVTIGEAIGDIAITGELAMDHVGSTNVDAYVSILVESYNKRQLIRICSKGLEDAGKLSADETIDSLLSGVDSIALGNGNESATFAQALDAAQTEMLAHNDGSGMKTGVPFIDRTIGGLRKKRLIIIGARPSWGKTALLLQMLLSSARNGSKAGIASLEMSRSELGMRSICNLSGMDYGRVSKGMDIPEFRSYCREYSDVQLTIDDTSSTISEVTARAHEWKHDKGLDVLGVDYLGLIRGGEGDSMRERMGDYCKRLRRMAKDLDICVVLLVQLNRQCEIDRRRPMMSDIRDCGDVEQDADAILSLNPVSQFNGGQREMELGWLKSRLCQPGWSPSSFVFDGRTQRFNEIDQGYGGFQ